MYKAKAASPPSQTNWRRIVREYVLVVRQHWIAYGLGTLTLLVTSYTEILTPKFIEWSLDLASGAVSSEKNQRIPQIFQSSNIAESLRLIGLAFTAALLVGLVGRIGWRQFLARRTHMTGGDLKLEMWNTLRFLPLRVFHHYPLGDLMNRATGDWNSARAIYGFTVVLTLDMVFFAVLAVGSMLLMDPVLTLYCLIVFPILPHFIVKLARLEHDQHIEAQENLSSLSEMISQSLGTIRLQRATDTGALWEKKLAKEAASYAKKRFAVLRTGLRIFPLGVLPTLVAYVILLIIGVAKIKSGQLTAGQFVAFQSYVLMLQVPLFELGDCIAEWQRGFASMRRLLEIFDLSRYVKDLKYQSVVPNTVTTQNVFTVKDLNFEYETKGRKVLAGVTLQISKGESIGLYGAIGSGKTTFLKLLSGLLDAPKNTILLYGTDLADVSREWLTSQLVMVPQKSFLFAGSIRYNLELSDSFSDDALWRVLRLVELEEDVRRFHNGLNCWVGEWGVNLSGGQKQRLSLARALLRPRGILLLDDCLSAVDAVTEERILTNMKKELGELTVVWVAHRQSTLKLCKRVFSLENGRLQEPRSKALKFEGQSKTLEVPRGVDL